MIRRETSEVIIAGPHVPNETDLVVTHILQGLIDGSMQLGRIFTEADIMRRTGLTRTPTREAMIPLADWGVVEKRPKVGNVVCPTDPIELRDLTTFAKQADKLAVAEWTSCIPDDDDLAALSDAARTMEESAAGFSAGDLVHQDSFLRAESGLHLTISSLTGKRIGTKVLQIRDVKRRVFRLVHPFLEVDDLQTVAQAGSNLADSLSNIVDSDAGNKIIDDYYNSVARIEIGLRERVVGSLAMAGIQIDQLGLESIIATQAISELGK